MENNAAVVVLANKPYLKYFENIYNDIREVGKYKGDIVLLTNFDTNCKKIYKFIDKNVEIKRFNNITFSKKTNKHLNSIQYGRNKNFSFQWHKFHLFDKYFKKWDYIFYLDINMKIRKSILPLLNLAKKDTLYAPYDAYPNLDWTLKSQFDLENIFFEKLYSNYDLENPKYFQTGILFYDTNIIKNDTVQKLINLVEKFPISKNNEQGIMNLFFMYEYPVFKQLPDSIGSQKTYSYWKLKDYDSIILKKNKFENDTKGSF